MSVMTVLCHGTGRSQVSGHHEKSGELISWIGNHLDGAEAKVWQHGSGQTIWQLGSFIINEGPGHKGEEGALLPQDVSAVGAIAPHTGLAHKIDRARGNMRGTGWTTNVDRTEGMLEEFAGQFTGVNLAGWSRGAVTCIRIANRLRMNPKTKHLRCNIFAVDPVAGAGSSKKEGVDRLGENVANYVAILAMHERGSWFKPQDWSRLSILDPDHTKVCMLPFPGLHSTLVTIKEPKGTAEIIRTLAVRFLEAHGTEFRQYTLPTNTATAQEMCEKYCDLIAYLSPGEGASWQTPMGTVGRGTIKRRSFNTHSKMDLYTRGGKSSYWINEHHEMCFKSAFRPVYDSFEHSALVSNKNARAKRALADLESNSPAVLRTLLEKEWVEWSAMDEPVFTDRPMGRPTTRNTLRPGSAAFPMV